MSVISAPRARIAVNAAWPGVSTKVILAPFDVFSVPPGVMRGLRNAGSEPAHILAILGGTDPGKATWSPAINARAEELGLYVNEDGDLVDHSAQNDRGDG